MPNMPSVRYNAMIYPCEAHCLDARDGYMNAYAAKDLEYKSKLKTEAFCIPFDSFPILAKHTQPVSYTHLTLPTILRV